MASNSSICPRIAAVKNSPTVQLETRGCPTNTGSRSGPAQNHSFMPTIVSSLRGEASSSGIESVRVCGSSEGCIRQGPCGAVRRQGSVQACAYMLQSKGGGVAQGLGIRLFAFGGAYWPLATAHSDPLRVRTCFGCVNGAPG